MDFEVVASSKEIVSLGCGGLYRLFQVLQKLSLSPFALVFGVVQIFATTGASIGLELFGILD